MRSRTSSPSIGDGEDQLRPLHEVAARAVEEIRQRRSGRLYLYGHCVGVALTLELARRLEAAGVVVDGVFLGAALPMLYGWLSGKIMRRRMRRQVATDDKVAEFLRFLGVGDDVAAGEFLLRAFRHDALGAIEYFEQIQRRGWPQPLATPLVALIGDRDPLTRDYPTRAPQWQLFSPRFTLSVIPGGAHYFVKEQVAEVARVITSSVGDAGVGTGPPGRRAPALVARRGPASPRGPRSGLGALTLHRSSGRS